MYAIFTGEKAGAHEVCIARHGRNKLSVTTYAELTDEQVTDLYWIVLAMQRTGKTLKELMQPDE